VRIINGGDLMKEFILLPVNIGDCQGFIIPKKHIKLDFKKQYRVMLEEVWEKQETRR